MRLIPTRLHGLLDDVIGLTLLLAPWALGFARDGPETWVPVLVGAGIIGGSHFTDYEWGAMPVIPMSTHLLLEFGSGVLLAASPWLLDFAEEVWLPHVIGGIAQAGVALLTHATPSGDHYLGRSLAWRRAERPARRRRKGRAEASS